MKPMPGAEAGIIVAMTGVVAFHIQICILPSEPAEMKPEPSKVKNFTTYFR